jgi:hypothetical protein
MTNDQADHRSAAVPDLKQIRMTNGPITKTERLSFGDSIIRFWNLFDA